jgi:DNA modification methylase|nr:hypothetical protein [uncultured Acetatifactor sp.]
MHNHKGYQETYERIMQFNKNKKEPFHRWYPFVEGYSKEFIQSIIQEMGRKDLVCLEPFSGSGTTALELQRMGIPCFSFEVNPMMYLVARVKLEGSYCIEKIEYWHNYIIDKRGEIESDLTSEFPTLYEGDGKEKWNYNKEVAIAVEKMRQAIDSISEEIYKDLFEVALASILLDVSNLYRNGKCLAYKKNWETRKPTEEEVFGKFDSKVTEEIEYDVRTDLAVQSENNKGRLYNQDARVGIAEHIKDNSIDLVITSPPYLNSRDYTDTYMLELKTLCYKTNKEIKQLREKTIRSHVQLKWEDTATIENDFLQKTLESLEKAAEKAERWNDSIIDMIRLYFVDMQTIYQVLYTKMKKGGRIYFNVSNSAYYNILIDTLEICAEISESVGFKVLEIRDARYLNASPQQKDAVGKLLEGVIVLEK